MASLKKLLLLSAFVASTVAVPVQQTGECARYCTKDDDFSLRPGSTYTYDYETTTVTIVQGSSDKTQLQMTAQADIEVLSKCELSLRLRGVTLKLSDPESPDYLVSLRGAREFARTIEKHIVRFSYQNGQVEHICPSENAPDWVTNIHRGVLSAFQSFTVKPEWTTRTMETDVLGKCTAEYHSLGKTYQGTHTVRKLKDLSSCTDRENVETYLQGSPYSQDFQTQSLPVIMGNQECEQVIGNNFLQTSTCNERLVFRPFSNRGNGVVTTVSQKLIFAATSQRKFTGNDYRPTTQPLLYSHAKQEVNSARIEEETELALKELCDVSQTDISIDVPRKFSAFVYKLKKLPFRSLKNFYQKTEKICPENKKARKFFMDAIPLVSTADSARFMYEMIEKKGISETESNFWLASLAFITESNPEIIATFTPLLDGRFDQAILGVSALIRNYCKGKDCAAIPQVQSAIHMLSRNLGENCFSPEDKKIILSLKAIGNIGYMFGKEKLLEACYKNPQLRNEVRLAAIEAFRRVSCDISREDQMKTYSNYNEDTEIRIASYLSVMKCASQSTILAVKDVLMNEKINHVGSFVWTHLNALSKSKHPERQEIRDIVSNLYLLNKFASDSRKFSSAHEANFFLESIDSGIHVDTHMIFSTESYLPRTAMFNLTVDIFGKSCNLLQLDGRIEGFEKVVESFFGPSGYFPQKNVARLLRDKRSVDNNKLRLIDSQFKEHLQNDQQPYGSMDIKVFGTSMWYGQYKHNDDGTPDINLLDIVSKLAEQSDQEYSRSFMFLDTTFTIPMTSGLPLRIALNGTASVGLKIGGKFDVKSFEHVDVLGHIEPSGAIEISGLLTVDAGHVARSGMRIISTMHSSSVLDGKLQVRRGEVVKAQLNMPRDRIDVFNIQSKMYVVHGTEERLKVAGKREGTHMQSCTGRTMSKIFGVKLCSELELPPYRVNTPLHPLSGPARFNLFIEKTDPTLKSYNFDSQWKVDMKNGRFFRHGIFSLNTPESQIDRDVKLELYLNHADHTATLKLKTPVKKIEMNGKLVNTDSQKKVDFSLSVDDKAYFTIVSELGISSGKNGIVYTPSLEVRTAINRLVAVSGMADWRFGQKYSGQLKVEDLTEKPILAKGNIDVGKRDRYDVEFSLNSFPLDGTFKGYAQLGDNFSTRMTADYKILEGKSNKLSIVGKMRNLSANALTKYTGILNIQASVLPEWNTELEFETMQTTGHIENSVSLSLGDGARSRVHTIKLQEILRYEGSLTNNKVEGSLKILYPERNVDYGLSIKHENTDHSLKNMLQVQYAKGKQINSDIQLKKSTGDLLSVAGDIKLQYPGRETALIAELTQSSNREYKASATCQWQAGKQVGAVVHYMNKSDGSRLKYEIDGNVKLPSSSAINYATIVGYNQGQFVGSAEFSQGSDKYRAKVDYSAGNGLNHRVSGQVALNNDLYGLEAAINKVKDKVSGDLELKMPNRHRVTAKCEGKLGDFLKYISIETYWDADRDTSKRFSVNGEMRSHGDGYDGKIVVQARRRIIKGSLSTSLQGSLFSSQWKTNNKIEMELSPTEKFFGGFSTNVLFDRSRKQFGSHIEILTPYEGFQNMSFNVAHLYSNQQWNSELSTLLPGGNDATLSTNGKFSFSRRSANFDVTAKATSSFRGFEEMHATMAHDHNARELTNIAELKWGQDKIIMYKVFGAKQSSSLKGSLRINTPFTYLKDISAEVEHMFTGNNFKSVGEFQWSPAKKIAFTTMGSHELDGRRKTCTITYEAVSPFRGYENTAMKISYSNDGSAVASDVELMWNRNKIASSLSAFRRGQQYDNNYQGKFTLSSPFRNYENVQISTSLELTESGYKFNLDTQLPHRSSASINSQGKMINFNDLELNTVLIVQIPKYGDNQRVSFDFVHKLRNNKLRTTLDTSYNSKRFTVVLIGLAEQGYNTRNLELSATINTPFKGFEEIKADFVHNRRSYEYFSKLQVNKNKLNAVLTHKLNVRDALNFETDMEIISTSSVPSLKFSVEQSTNGRQFEHTSYIQWDKNSKVHLIAQYSDKVFIKEAIVKLTTPFRNYRDIELKASMECQDYDHKGMISFQWERRNKMTLSADIKNYRWESMDARIEFTSPFRNYEFYATTLKYDLTAPQKEVIVSFLWDAINKKSIVAKGNFVHSHFLRNLDLSLTTPFKDFEETTFSVKYEHIASDRNVFVRYQRGWRLIAFTGKTTAQRGKAQISLEFSSPYRHFRDLTASAKYNKYGGGMSGEIAAQWNKQDSYNAKGSYELADGTAKASLQVSSPFKNYEQLSLDISGNSKGSTMSSEISLTLNPNQRILLNADVTKNNGMGEFNLRLQTPFESYQDLSIGTRYKATSGNYEASLKATLNEAYVYEGSVESELGGSHLVDIKMIINTPVSPMKNVQLLLTVDSTQVRQELMSTLKWEDKEANLHLLLNNKGGVFYEAKAKLNTPFKNYKLFSFDSSLRNDKNQFLDGRITIATPFDNLRSFDAYGEFKNDDAGYLVLLNVITPSKKVVISGKLFNSNFTPFTASMKIEAPFTSFKEVSSEITMNILSWSNAKTQISLKSPAFNHKWNVEFSHGEGKTAFATKVESSSLPTGQAIASVTADYKDLNRISAESSLQLFGKVHYFTGQYKLIGRNTEVLVKVESPLLPDGQSQVMGKLSKRRSTIDGEINFVYANTNHQATTKYENRNNQITTSMKLNSDFLPSSSLEAQAKYINNNGRDFEVSLSMSTPESTHTVTGNLKNYEGDKYVQLKIACPMSTYSNPLTLTGTLRHEGYKSIDVSLSANAANQELRIAGNMKNEGWKNVEAFLTVNTPFETLKMVRIDGRFNNDRFQTIDSSFQIETSHPKLPLLGITSKLNRAQGSEEVSLMLHLPIRNYRSVQLLGNVHYNSDYSSADSRITFTLPKGKYVVYGQYGLSRSRISGRGEIEVNNAKWSATGRLERSSEKKDIAFTVTTPSALTYTVGGAYGKSGNTKTLAATYHGPSNERYIWNSSLTYDTLYNFGLEFQLQTPFYNYRNIECSIQQQSSSSVFSTNIEFNKDGEKSFLKANQRYQRDGLRGAVQLGCPLPQLKDVKITYSRVKKSTNVEDSMELHYNRAKQLKMEVLLFGKKSSHFILDVPALPLTITADSKALGNGRELNFRSNYMTRIVSFRTSYQNDNRQILHDAAFSWDERAEKRVSYDFKLASTEPGMELWSRVDTPIRSLMLKGNFTKSSRSSSGGIDFFWDASRSLEKHMALGIVHSDISTGQHTSHKVEIVMEHPKLSKDIVQTNTLSYSTNEVHFKSELHYSRERHHNLLMEVKANDLSRNARDQHYKGEFTLRHPASRMDIRGMAEAMNSKLESSAYMRLNSLDRNQAQNVREMKAKLMKLRQEMEISMRSNDDQVQLAGQVAGRNGDYDILLEKKTNEQKDLTTRVKFSRRNRALDISVMNTENTGVHFGASFGKESANLKISHLKQGNEINDAAVYLGLEESKILKSKINWRPRLMEDLRITTGETLRGFIAYSKAFFADWSSTFAEEMSMRWSMLSRSGSDLLVPFFEDMRTAKLEVESDLRVAKDAFWLMYRRNEFHMRDIVNEFEHIKEVTKSVANHIALGCQTLYYIVEEQIENIYDSVYYTCLDMFEYLQKLQSELMWKASRTLRILQLKLEKYSAEYMKKLEKVMEEFYSRIQKWSNAMVIRFDKWLRSYAPCLIDGYYYTKNAADKIRYSINRIRTTISDCVLTNRYFIALQNYGISIANTFNALYAYEYRDTAQEFLNRIYDVEIMDTIRNHPTVDYMSGMAHSALRKSVEVYHNLGMDVVVANAAKSASNYAKTMAINAAQQYLSEIYQTKAGAKYDYEPRRGFIGFEVTLPAPRSTLMEVFDYKTYPEYRQLMNVNTLATEYYEDFCIWDFYYKFMKYLTPSFWLPTFNAHALISGNQHFITFDKLSYDFAGKCSYLLARDFVDGNFTAIVNYGTQDHARRSLTILVDNRKVDISHDYKITLDNNKAELPIQIGSTVMIREGANVRVENEKKGFSIVCNFVHNYCSLSVSGFYFGRTAGLLGTFNYEPSLDMMTPKRYVMEDIESFTKEWEVGQAICTSYDNFATLPTNNYRVHQKCKELFQKSTSEFRACFKQVNPETYLKMCISDLSAVHEDDHKDAICESAAAYFVECKTEGVPLKMPKHCVKCEKQDGTYMKEGDAIQFPRDGSVTAADVVFLVEEKECNREKVKYLTKFAEVIESNYRQKGYRDVRYSVVAFGGDLIHAEPHVHTMDGRESGPLRSLESAFQSLEFGNGPVNILEAIRFAAALTYRPGTSKSFILLKCSACKSEEVRAEYSEMLRTLLDGDISLHLLMEQQFEMKIANKNSKARKVIGVDKRLAYTLKDVKDTRLSGDLDLLPQLRIPKDVCTPLAFEVNGTSFDANFLTETKKNTNKKFMDILARLVVKSSSMGTTDWGMCCECLATEDGVGKSTCQRCVSAEMASMVSSSILG